MSESDAVIAIVTPYASSRYFGGVEIFNTHLKRALGHVEIFSDRGGSPGILKGALRKFGMEQPYRAFHVARSLAERSRTQRFKLVISNGIFGWPLSFWDPDIPMVQVYHLTMAGLAGQALELRGDRLTTGKVAAFFDRLAGRGKHVVAVSPQILKEVETYYGLTGQVIPNTVDTTLFQKGDRIRARQELGLPAEATIGLFVGRAEYAKGFDIFLEVVRSMRDVLFAFVGRCSLQEPNVQVFQEVPHVRMPMLYASADFFFLPSRYEGFNLSILEALACDLPIVMSHQAYPFADDPTHYGYVAKSLRPQEFVLAIREILSRRSSYSPRSRIVARYSFDLFKKNWNELVSLLLEDDQRRGRRFNEGR